MFSSNLPTESGTPPVPISGKKRKAKEDCCLGGCLVSTDFVSPVKSLSEKRMCHFKRTNGHYGHGIWSDKGWHIKESGECGLGFSTGQVFETEVRQAESTTWWFFLFFRKYNWRECFHTHLATIIGSKQVNRQFIELHVSRVKDMAQGAAILSVQHTKQMVRIEAEDSAKPLRFVGLLRCDHSESIMHWLFSCVYCYGLMECGKDSWGHRMRRRQKEYFLVNSHAILAINKKEDLIKNVTFESEAWKSESKIVSIHCIFNILLIQKE